MCEHNINKEKHDMILETKTKVMCFPPQIWGICSKCGKSITFIKVKDVFLEL